MPGRQPVFFPAVPADLLRDITSSYKISLSQNIMSLLYTSVLSTIIVTNYINKSHDILFEKSSDTCPHFEKKL